MIYIDNKLYNILSLNYAFGAGSRRAISIYDELSKKSLLDVPLNKAVDRIEIDDDIRNRLLKISTDDIKNITGDCKDFGITIIPIYDSRYPRCLRYIPTPPLVLFAKGNVPDFDNEPTFCIVGPRKITDFGQKAAYSLARRLSLAGMIIVSGSAKGGDFSTHMGVLNASGRSVMVATEGILTLEKSNKYKLCNDVLKNGCIISEALPKHVVRGKYEFRIRNRIMSGLSLGVAVVEAPEISGTLSTASHAAEQGRDVFVIPGNPTDNAYKGSNALLRDGAIPLINASDIFTRYITDFPEQIDIEKAYNTDKDKKLKKYSQKKPLSTLSKDAQLVYNNLVKPEFTLDDLCDLGMDASNLLSALTELEIEHLIKSLPGGVYKISD